MAHNKIQSTHEEFLQNVPGIDQLSGKLVANYRLDTYLGRTNIAHIYSVRKIGGSQLLSVYLFPNQYSNESNFVDQFMLQSGILRELEHKNINPVIDYGVEHGFPYLVTKYAASLSLIDLIQTAKLRMVRVPLTVGLYIFNTVGNALSYAHNVSVSHGDIHANNVLLVEDGDIVLTDFCFKTFFSKVVLDKIKETGPLVTDDYSYLKLEIDEDIFSLAVLFYKTITSHLPYTKEEVTPNWIYKNIETIELDSLTKYVPELPQEIENSLKIALKQDSSKQYQSVDEFITDISAYKEKVKTSILPTAHLSNMLAFSSRFSNSSIPNEFDVDEKKKIALFFLDTGQVLELDNDRQYTLGRNYENSPMLPDIDLTPFKAYEWGISRLHAFLDIKDNQVSLIDNNSSNGTFQGGRRIESNKPYLLHHGNIFMLGKLRLQILISEE